MTVRIREAVPADADAIARVHVASWRWAYAGLLPDLVLDGLSIERRSDMWRGWFASHPDRSCLLVADDDGEVVGFSGAGPSDDNGATPETAELHTLYLLEPSTGRGIGRRLFGEVADALRTLDYTHATLWVMRDAARARRFYEAAGWATDGVAAGYPIGGVEYPIVRYAVDL